MEYSNDLKIVTSAKIRQVREKIEGSNIIADKIDYFIPQGILLDKYQQITMWKKGNLRI